MFRELVRKNKELSKEECIKILTEEKRGVLSVLGDEEYPYGMPMNHFYNIEDGAIYFHCGNIGHRLDALRKDNKVSFCTYDEGYRKPGQWALNIKSVIVFGRMHTVEDSEKANQIYRSMSLKYTSDIEYIDSEIQKFAKDTVCYELQPEHITGKIVNES